MSAVSMELTPGAQACLDGARQIASAHQAAQVEPEHVLMAMLTPAAGSAWNLLLGVVGDPSWLRQQTEGVLADLPVVPGALAPALGFRAQRVIDSASDVARQAESKVDSPHLLVGLMEEGGAAAGILRQIGLDARALRARLRQKLPATTGEAPAAPVQPAPIAAPRRRVVVRRPMVTGPLRTALPRLIDWRAVALMIGLMVVGGWLATQPDNETAGVVIFILSGWIFSVCAHEFGHALAADVGGDQTVREKGYLSFNPLAYTHPLLSIIMPLLFLFLGGIGLPGGAVYIETQRLRGPRWNSIVSAAGPLASLIVVLLLSLLFHLGLERTVGGLGLWGALSALVMLNLWAVLFNVLPVPPLDGFGILAPFLPVNVRTLLYSFGFLGLWLLIFAFWSNSELSQAFWNVVAQAMESLGVSPLLASYGIQRFMFWR